MAYKISHKKLKDWEKDEIKDSKKYHHYGLNNLSKDEKKHYHFLKNLEKKNK